MHPKPGTRAAEEIVIVALVVVAVVAAAMLYFGFHMAALKNTSAVSKTSPPRISPWNRSTEKRAAVGPARQAVLLNFWATWCGPCKIETPWLVELQNQYGSQGLRWSVSRWMIRQG
jgi:thiol-disulfide isomerase/thioredoxin